MAGGTLIRSTWFSTSKHFIKTCSYLKIHQRRNYVVATTNASTAVPELVRLSHLRTWYSRDGVLSCT